MIPAICRLSRNYVTMSHEPTTNHVITWHYVTWFLQYAASGYVSATQRTLQLLWFTPWHVWRVWHDAFTTGHESCNMQHVGTLQCAACGHVPTARRTATTMVYCLNVWHDAFTQWHDSFTQWHDSYTQWHDSFTLWHDSFTQWHDSFTQWHDSVNVQPVGTCPVSHAWHDVFVMWHDSLNMQPVGTCLQPSANCDYYGLHSLLPTIWFTLCVTWRIHTVTWRIHIVTWLPQCAARGYVPTTRRELRLLWFTPSDIALFPTLSVDCDECVAGFRGSGQGQRGQGATASHVRGL